MTIKQKGAGAESAWEVWAGNSRRRLFVWRKLGGADAALELAKDEERRLKAENPSAGRRLVHKLAGLLRRGVAR